MITVHHFVIHFAKSCVISWSSIALRPRPPSRFVSRGKYSYKEEGKGSFSSVIRAHYCVKSYCDCELS